MVILRMGNVPGDASLALVKSTFSAGEAERAGADLIQK
jgi:hypothetical protein